MNRPRTAAVAVLSLILLASSPARPARESNETNGRAPSSDTRVLLLELADKARLWNGYTELREFEQYDAEAAAESLEQFTPDTRYCGFATVTETSDALTRLALEDSSTAKTVRRLQAEGRIQAVLLREPVRGEREYCRLYTFAIFTQDGLVLYLHYDFTT